MSHPIVLAMTGASGAVYGVRLLQQLLLAGRQVHLTISPAAWSVMEQELALSASLPPTATAAPATPPAADRSVARYRQLLGYAWPAAGPGWVALSETDIATALDGQLQVHDHRDYFTPIASGSHRTAGMVICPCSGSTLGQIVHAAGGNLIHRAAEVHMKERRKLIVVPRETPLSLFQLDNMRLAAEAGIVVLPAAPGFYHEVRGLLDLVDFVVARVLDQLEVPHRLMRRWQTSD
jgi:flavin prenyltransferase